MNNVRKERTGWRDQELNERHRRWGWDCPAIDLDFLFIEYDKGKAAALVEYKNEFAKPQYTSHPSFQALILLGDASDIPVIGVRYASDFSWWKVVPLNDKAKTYIPEIKTMNEVEYVTMLYAMRGRVLGPDVLKDMDKYI